MMAKETRAQGRIRRHQRVRRKVHGTADRPRLNVFRSLQHIYAQVINDDDGNTIAAASTLDPALRASLSSMSKVDEAKAVGKLVAERAKEKGVESVVFDRGGYQYHGRVKALADASRESGLNF
ncbi:MAG: 50S ribosomal protein L18 [Caldilineaceae bacterium]|nr:50S ribosomal protein L18 [Caldilineaceae bacterium]